MTDSPLAVALKTRLANELADLAVEIPQPDMLTLLNAVDDVLAEFEDDSPLPFVVGRAVTHRDVPEVPGVVAKRIEHNGELHTIGVRWDGAQEISLHSPRELIEVPA
jgi:hypothetical protein